MTLIIEDSIDIEFFVVKRSETIMIKIIKQELNINQYLNVSSILSI